MTRVRDSGRPGDKPLLVVFNWRDTAHPEAGGAELVCEQLARRLAERGDEVVLLTAASERNPPVERRDGYTVVRRGGRFSVYPMALAWLFRRRRRISGVIDSQNGIPSFAPLVLRPETPIVLLMHHVHQDQFATAFPPLGARLAQLLESTATRWVYGRRVIASVSPSTRRDVRIRLRLKGPSFVVPPGAPGVSPLVGGRSPVPRIVCVGRLVPQKRTELVVAAMVEVRRRHPDAELVVVGDGPRRAALAEQVARLGLQDCVRLTGPVPDAERESLMATAWLTVSASEREGWGLTILEANAHGVPALAWRVPGLKDAIRHGETGWLVPPHEDLAPAIAEALTQLREPATVSAFERRARAWVGCFSWDAMADRIAALLRDEARQLPKRRSNRRVASDLSCVAEVPRKLLPPEWATDLRLGDQVVVRGERVTFLFHGADTQSVRRALSRLGLDLDALAHPGVRTHLARPTDHLVLGASGALAEAPGRLPARAGRW